MYIKKGLSKVLHLVIMLIFVFSIFSVQGYGTQTEPTALARVEVTENIDALNLPVYAHFRDAAGLDYAIVKATVSQLVNSRVKYKIIDSNTEGESYILASGLNTKLYTEANRIAKILYHDGLRLIIRGSQQQAESLAIIGLDIGWLEDKPIIFSSSKTQVHAHRAITYNSQVGEMINSVSQSTVNSYTAKISGETPVTIGGSSYTITTRNTNSGVPIQKATQYAYEFMRGLGLETSYHNWTMSSSSGRNIIGSKKGTTKPDEIILITAHYDDMPASGLAPGADDNASGSVGVMLAAEILNKYSFERTIRFVLFTGEEQGLFGSKAYANLVAGNGEKVAAVYNMDMIATDTVNRRVITLHTRPTSNPAYTQDLSICNLFSDVVKTYGLSSGVTVSIENSGESRSDHASFWAKGIPAALAIEGDFSKYYHTPNDKLSTLNMPFFTNVLKASIGTAAHLAYPVTDTTPTSTPTYTPTATPTPTPTQEGYKISGYINPDLISSDANIKAGFKVEIMEAGKSALTDTAGYFEIKSIPGSSSGYTIKIGKANYLSRTAAGVKVVSDIGLGTKNEPVGMWAGDILTEGIQDNAINMSDIMEVVKGFNSVNGDDKYISGSDLDKDGAINMSDILIVVQHINTTPENYPPINIITVTHTPTPTPTQTVKPTPIPTDPNGYPAWDSNSYAYAAGNRVSYQGNNYECIMAHTSNSAWDPVSTLNVIWKKI
ncbi:MAG: M20/M25/M40 family metallo-hydrolase [Clostridia bacterium]|nr:M20/M25/M40 family metallo-hydrolase [Clostridia bacterium]